MTDNPLIWALIGIIAGFSFWKTQQLSLNLLNPQKANKSLRLIIITTFLRWLFISGILVIAISQSIMAMFTVFITFMTTRIFFLLKWQGWLRAND
jgi:hypothetical protein